MTIMHKEIDIKIKDALAQDLQKGILNAAGQREG